MRAEEVSVYLEQLEEETLDKPMKFEVSKKNTYAYYNNNGATLRVESYNSDGISQKNPIEFHKKEHGERHLRFIIRGTPDGKYTISQLLKSYDIETREGKRRRYVINMLSEEIPTITDHIENYSTIKLTHQIDWNRFFWLFNLYIKECFTNKPPLNIEAFLHNKTNRPSDKRM
jgi:hypothetical protein